MSQPFQTPSDTASGINAIARAIRDLIEVFSAATTLTEGEFQATLTGMTATTTGTIKYRIIGDADGTGKICYLYAESAITGTSNTTALTMTGIPAACTPAIAVNVSCNVLDSGGGVQAGMTISAAGTTATFFCDTPLSSTGFTNSGSKGLPAGWNVSFNL